MTAPIKQILSRYDANGLSLRNRLAVAPMTRVSAAEDGAPTQAICDYYLRFANGGFGLVFTEGLYTDKEFSQGYRFQPGLADERQAKAWTGITAAMQAEGTAVFAQIMHAGALSQGNRFRSGTVAPSAVQPKGQQMAFYYGTGGYAVPSALTQEQIQDVVQAFVDTAVRAHRVAGFDGVEIHGANGYLLDQFLTEASNQRTDQWGGSVSRRVALLSTIVKEVKSAVGGAVPVGIRISQGKVNDFTSKWSGGESDAELIFGSLSDAGTDFIHVTEFEAWKPAFPSGTESLIALARRYAPKATIIGNGSLHSDERAAEALQLGADVVAIGRGALANPDLPKVFERRGKLRDFDSSILGPIANIKKSELAFGGT